MVTADDSYWFAYNLDMSKHYCQKKIAHVREPMLNVLDHILDDE